jgi:hypothetical protein
MIVLRVSDELHFDDRGVLIETPRPRSWWSGWWSWWTAARRIRTRALAGRIQGGEPPWICLPASSDPITFRGEWDAVERLEPPCERRVHWLPNLAGFWLEMRRRRDGGLEMVPLVGFGPTRGATYWDAAELCADEGRRITRVAWAARQDLNFQLLTHSPFTVTVRVRLKEAAWNPRIHLAWWTEPLSTPA